MKLKLRELLEARRAPQTVPPLDGPWTPNDALEAGRVVFQDDGLLDAVLLDATTLAVLTRAAVVLIHPETGEKMASAAIEGRATAICVGAGGVLVAVEGRGVTQFGGTDLSQQSPYAAGSGLPDRCVTAMSVTPSGVLWLAQGSDLFDFDEWKRDLLTRGSSGSLWKVSPTRAARVVHGLAWPAGLYADDGRVVISESWKHRIISVDPGNARRTIITDDLPAYPTHLSRGPDGQFALGCGLPRSSLVEFVIREKEFVRSMIDSLDERAWVVPQLSTLRHPLEQVQGGELLVFGQVKPWAPTRSYGLAALLDEDLRPIESLHSRANGRRHGVVRVIELRRGRLLCVSRGAGDISLVQVPRRTHVKL